MSNGLFRLRIRYGKQGRLRFLSHLELSRALERAIRRAKLPYAVTQGFHPHMKIAFCSALPVGCASDDEYCDVWLEEFIEPDQVLAMLASSSVPDLTPLGVEYVTKQEDSLTVSLSRCFYTAHCDFPSGIDSPAEKLEALISESLVAGSIEVKRKAKRKKGRPQGMKTKSYDLKVCLLGQPTVEAGDEPNSAIVSFGIKVLPEGTLRPDVYVNTASDLFAAQYGDPFIVSLLTRTKQATEEDAGGAK